MPWSAPGLHSDVSPTTELQGHGHPLQHRPPTYEHDVVQLFRHWPSVVSAGIG